MSWLFSRALVEEYSEGISLDGEPSVQSNGNPTPQAYLCSDKMMRFSRLSRFGMTFRLLRVDRGEALLMSYLEGFPVRTSQPQERAQELTVSDQACGEKWQGSFAKYDPDTHALRTHQCSLLEDLTESCQTLPAWGLMRDGECWEQPTLGLRIRGTESGLWPTPTAHMAKETNAPSEALRNEPSLSSRVGGKLNPDWVEWLMNWPIKWSDINEFDPKEFKRWKKESAETLQKTGLLRTMWWERDPSQTPFRSRHDEQQSKQHSNSLPEMSWGNSRQRKMERPHQGQDVSVLRQNIHIQTTEGKNLQQGMRQQISLDEAQIVPRIADNITARVDRLKAIGNGQVPAVAATAFRLLSNQS